MARFLYNIVLRDEKGKEEEQQPPAFSIYRDVPIGIGETILIDIKRKDESHSGLRSYRVENISHVVPLEETSYGKYKPCTANMQPIIFANRISEGKDLTEHIPEAESSIA